MSLLDILEDLEPQPALLTPDEFLLRYRSLEPSVMAFDTESPTYKWHLTTAIPFALTFSWSKEHTYYVSCAGDDAKPAAEALYEVLAKTPVLIGHHIKYDLHVAKKLLDPFDIPLLTRRIEDTMILDAVLDESRHHGLKERCTDLGITFDGSNADDLKAQITVWIDEASKREGRAVGYDEVPARLMVPYALQDAYLTLELYRYLKVELEEQMQGEKKQRDLNDIYTLELRLLWVLFQMEERGMRIDADFVVDQIAQLTPTLTHDKTALREKLGFDMNPLATDDVAQALKQLGQEAALWTNPRTGKINLPEWRMEQLYDEVGDSEVGTVVRSVLRYRTNAKMLNSYYEPLLHESNLDERGQSIVRCNNKQMGARTGRMSVTEPALQTIPRDKGEVRSAFIARENHLLLFADYSQQELRVLAHYMKLVGDPSMSVIFAEGKIDLHQETAAAMFAVAYENVTKEERRLGKETNFAIVYGAGIKKIAAMHGVDDDTAKMRLNRMYGRFPGLRKLKSVCEGRMREREYVVTAFGRRHREREGRFAYKAINSLVQGTSADVTKSAMVRIDDAFRQARMDSMVLLSVHDEVISEAPLDEVAEAERIVREAMLFVPEILVPMEVELAVASRWSEAK